MLSSDFYGKRTIFWDGIVETRDDPLRMGRVQVRIFGLHSLDQSQLPTKDLPYAQVVYSPNGSKFSDVPPTGSWVHGFFLDGESSQIPIVTGVYSRVGANTSYSYINGAVYQIPSEQNPPVLPDGQVFQKEGEPTTARNIRGEYEGTPVKKSNDSLSCSSDIKIVMKSDITAINMKFNTTVQTLRDAINAILGQLGSDPTGMVSLVISECKQLIADVKEKLKVIKEIQELIKDMQELINDFKNFINFIIALPTKLVKFVVDCLKHFMNSFTSSLSSTFSLSSVKKLITPEIDKLLTGAIALKDNVIKFANSPTDLLSNLNTNTIDETSLDNISKSIEKTLIADVSDVTNDITKTISAQGVPSSLADVGSIYLNLNTTSSSQSQEDSVANFSKFADNVKNFVKSIPTDLNSVVGGANNVLNIVMNPSQP